jgi:uncharacterized protein (DUF2235 family)
MTQCHHKRIILSSDGTGNAGGQGYNTNVWNLHTAIDRNDYDQDHTKVKQIAFYDDGVGVNQSVFMEILGGAFGLGLSANVIELYTFLVYNYQEKDKIYLFGFSRGGFTIRIVAEIIATMGILKLDADNHCSDDELKLEIRAIYNKFRANAKKTEPSDQLLSQESKYLRTFIKHVVCICNKVKSFYLVKHLLTITKKLFYYTVDIKQKIIPSPNYMISHQVADADYLSEQNFYKPEIEFIGIWDTVDAYAIPTDSFAYFINHCIYSFQANNRQLHKKIKKACHALAIDDERQTFHPVLWDEDEEQKNQLTPRIEQVWFAGVHANTGGGYPKQGLSWTALDWMMEKAKSSGLRFSDNDHEQYIENGDYNDHLYDSRKGLSALYIYKPRNMAFICQSNHTATNIHISVLQRILSRTRGYAPINFPANFNIVTGSQFDPQQKIAMNQLVDNIQKRIQTDNLLEKHKFGIEFRKWQNIILLEIAILLVVIYWLFSPSPLLIMGLFLLSILVAVRYSNQYKTTIHSAAQRLWNQSIAEDNWDIIRYYKNYQIPILLHKPRK